MDEFLGSLMHRWLFLAGSFALSATLAAHPAAPLDARCQSATTAAATLSTQKTTDEAELRGLTRAAPGEDGQLALIAAITVQGACSRSIDGADLTTMHLPSGEYLALDSEDQVIAHPGGYVPSAPDRTTIPHPAIEREHFVMGVTVAPRSASGDAQYVAIYSAGGASRLYQYSFDAQHGLGKPHSLLASDTELLSISALPDIDTPAQGLYLLQASPHGRRLLIYRWARVDTVK